METYKEKLKKEWHEIWKDCADMDDPEISIEKFIADWWLSKLSVSKDKWEELYQPNPDNIFPAEDGLSFGNPPDLSYERPYFKERETIRNTAFELGYKQGYNASCSSAIESLKKGDFKEEHICRFNDGEINCECYLAGLDLAIEKLEELKK